MFQMNPNGRARRTPFHNSVVSEGVTNAMVYNYTILPTGYGKPEEEYWRIINGVSMWDVSCERQVQIKGPDAATLAQMLSPRDLSKQKIDQGKYVALCNHQGTIINDPIVIKRAADTYWFSIADSNIWFWARAIAAERGLNVEITEPDVSPLAVQGPKAEEVVANIFGDWVKDIRYFWSKDTEINGIPVSVARSGWSKQGGFEIYLLDGRRGDELWNIVKEAGKPYGIGPGNPNAVERIESGLLSWGVDTDENTNPFEIRMEPFVDLHVSDDVVGIKALRQIKEEGPKRHQLGMILDTVERMPSNSNWCNASVDGHNIGHLTNSVWSYRMEKNIGFALVSRDFNAGDHVNVDIDGVNHTGKLVELPFL